MNNNQNLKENSNKALPEVFKELKEIQRKQIAEEIKYKKSYKNNKLHKIIVGLKDYLIGTRFDGIYIPKTKKTNKRFKQKKNINKIENDINDIDSINYINMYKKENHIHKFNAIGVVIGVLFLVLFFASIEANYVFATQNEEKDIIGNYEENENPIDLMNILSENMSEVVKKDISTEEEIIERDVEYIENNQLPKDEQIVLEEGFDGSKDVTYIRSYENNVLTEEKIIAEHVKLEPSRKVISVGTSEYLLEKQAHIGDTMYTIEEVYMADKPEETVETICKIYQYIDVVLNEVLDGWCKVTVDGFEGYIPSNTITSAALQPEIVEISRIQRIMVRVRFDMLLNKPSGLTRDDYIKVLSNNPQDKNKIFEENAELFYDLEQKYNVNGILLAAIGIHESAWGTSKISIDKKNLFGYGAYDSSPYSSSFTFDTYGEGIELIAKYYLNEAGTEIYDGETAVASYYNGATVSGINVRYASDSDWAVKVFDKMQMLYEKLK